jgi:membrane-associated PAP2 superfamily phosphatase
MAQARAEYVELLLRPSLGFVYGFVVLQLGDVDHAVVGLFSDPSAQGFPWRHAFLTETLLHDVAQATLKVVLLGVLLAWLVSLMRRGLAPWRRPLGYLAFTILLSIGIVNAGKQVSNVDCPWDLQEFGGQRTFHGLFDAKPADEPLGRCFPAGHSSSGFALFGLFFLARRHPASRSRARLWLLPALLLGVTFSVVQWSRGAHFPSHDLTTAYVCWLLAVLGHFAILHPYPDRRGG